MFGGAPESPCNCGKFMPSEPKFESDPVDVAFMCRECLGVLRLSDLIKMKEAARA